MALSWVFHPNHCFYVLYVLIYAFHAALWPQNEDFGRQDKRSGVHFQSTFQGCEYSIWATRPWKLHRKLHDRSFVMSSPHCKQTPKSPIERCSYSHETPIERQNGQSGFGDFGDWLPMKSAFPPLDWKRIRKGLLDLPKSSFGALEHACATHPPFLQTCVFTNYFNHDSWCTILVQTWKGRVVKKRGWGLSGTRLH